MAKTKKAIRAEIREELRASGLLPQPKPRLNRKEFSRKTQERWKTAQVSIMDFGWALAAMVPNNLTDRKITSEQIGALKVMALTMDIAEWRRKNLENGTIGELYEQVVKPIIEL